MAMFGLRIGSNPQCMISTTPRPIPILRELIDSEACVKTFATTYDNLEYLAPTFFDSIIKRYEGSRLGQHTHDQIKRLLKARGLFGCS